MTEEEVKDEVNNKSTTCMRCDTAQSDMWYKGEGLVLCTQCSMDNKTTFPKNCKRIQPSRKVSVYSNINEIIVNFWF